MPSVSGRTGVHCDALPALRVDAAGTVIFPCPLREARIEGYFSTIDFTAVLDLDEDDETLATAALSRLRSDLDARHEHLLMPRVGRSLEPTKSTRFTHTSIPSSLQGYLRLNTGERT